MNINLCNANINWKSVFRDAFCKPDENLQFQVFLNSLVTDFFIHYLWFDNLNWEREKWKYFIFNFISLTSHGQHFKRPFKLFSVALLKTLIGSKSLSFGPQHGCIAKNWPSSRFGLPMAGLDNYTFCKRMTVFRDIIGQGWPTCF